MADQEPVYGFRSGGRYAVPAQAVGERLATLTEQYGRSLQPGEFVDDARPEEAVLHPLLEWDDFKAAESHRRTQARQVIRDIVVRPDPEAPATDKPPAPYFISVKVPERDKPAFVTIDRVMTEPELLAQAIADVLRAMQGLRARYGHFRELQALFEAADQLHLPLVAV